MRASAVLHFNKDGQMTDFLADRYREAGGEFVLEKWSTPIKEYAEISGIRLPVKGEAVWHLNSGDFCYFKAEIEDVEFSKAAPYQASW